MLHKIDEHTSIEFICKGGEDHQGCEKSKENGIEGEIVEQEFRVGYHTEVFPIGVRCEFCHAGAQQITWKE